MNTVDYHIHTNFSDGDLSPEQIVERYLQNGYRTIAITDHDTFEGSIAAVTYSLTKNIDVIPGIEFTTRDEFENDIHMLGYGFDYFDEGMLQVVREIKMNRARRNDKMLRTLNDLGYSITIDDLYKVNEGRCVGNSTFAKVLVEMGVDTEVDKIFKGLFRQEPIRSIRKKTISTRRAIEIINAAGGIAVFAHPMEVRRRDENREDFYIRVTGIIDTMIDQGLGGIECYHPSANERDSEVLRTISYSNNLCITRGSDFHSDLLRRDYEG